MTASSAILESQAESAENGSTAKSPPTTSITEPTAPGPPQEIVDSLLAQMRPDNLHRGLRPRHIEMMGIAGAIGTGLFLGLGGAILTAGPLGALLAYTIVGLVVCAVQFAIGETSALFPVSGCVVVHAEYLIDPAWGFAMGVNLIYGAAFTIPAEITAACVLFGYWTDINTSVIIVAFTVATFVVGMSLIRVYGEVEFWFALLKILLIVFLIIFGLVVALGGLHGVPATYFTYWKHPGPFVEYIARGDLGRFLGCWSAITTAVYSFSGIEFLTVAAGETRNPRKSIPVACRNVFLRVTLFYILSIITVGMLVSSEDPRLTASAATAAQSPFVIAVASAGLPAIPSVINAIVMTSAWTVCNQNMLAGTRILYGLALKGQAPKIFLRTTSWGAPYISVAFFGLCMCLSLLSLSKGALNVFYWFLRLASAGILFTWGTIFVNHIRMRLAFDAQSISSRRLPWYHCWTLYSSFFGLFMCILILFTSGFAVFIKGHWSASNFVAAYVDIVFIFTFYFAYKFYNKTKIVPLIHVPIEAALDVPDEDLGVPASADVEKANSRKFRAMRRFIFCT